MAIQNKVVIHNSSTKKHEPLASGDKLSGNLVQLSSDVGNPLTIGTDGGLKVSIPAQLPDDQVLTGDNTGSVSVTLTPTVVGDQTNYLIKADIKVDPAAGNAATVSSAGVFVPAPVVPTFTAGNAPTIVDDGTTTTQYFGGNDIALGNPTGWEKRVGTTKVYPVYDEGSVGGGVVTVGTASKQTEFGTQAATNANYQTYVITFATAFPTAPFVTLSSSIKEDLLSWKALNVTATGFLLEGYGNGPNNFTGNVNWKAEEK